MTEVYTSDAHRSAVDYRERGWSPIPIKARSKAPKLPKDHPFLRRKATDDEFGRFDFRHNVGIVAGRVSGIIVLDDDDGGETMRKNGWHVPPTPTVKTKRGYQYYFRCPEVGLPTFDVVTEKVEVRGDGAYVVAPPSVHHSGSVYEWVISPDEADLADPPAWLMEQAAMRGRRMQAEDIGATIANGSRNKALFSIAGTLRRRGLDETTIHAALLGINRVKCETPLPEEEVRKIAHSAARYEPGRHQHEDADGTGQADRGAAASGEGEREVNPLLAGRVLLGAGIAGGMEPPDELEPGILLRGKVHSVYAGPGTGKTMFMLWIVTQCLAREQTVVLLDMENGPRIIAERLRSLGASAEQVDRFLCYIPSPNLPITDEAKAAYAAMLDQVRPDLVVFDSWINFLASAGMDENSSNDVAGWAVAFTHPARDRGIASLLLDHVPHEGGHARGSTRKKDEVDVMWRLHNTQPFDRDSVGEIVLHREKDREAWLPPSVRFSVGGGSAGFVFNRSAGTIEETATGDLTDRQRMALDALRGFGKQGARYGEWQRASGLKGTTFDRAISALTVRGLVRKVDGRYFVRPEKQPPRGSGAGEGGGGSTTGSTPTSTPTGGGGESPVDKADHDYPRVPPSNPHAENGGSGDHNPRYPHTPKSGGNGGNPDDGLSEDPIRAVLADPPAGIAARLREYEKDPDERRGWERVVAAAANETIGAERG